jgi:hypothetical protein
VRHYNLKAIKIESAGGQLGLKSSSSVPDTNSDYRIADLFAIVKAHDKDFEKDSKHPVYLEPNPVNPILLNEDGTPKVFYHGTNSKWTT